MLILHWSLAAGAVGALALAPRSAAATLAILAAAALDALLGAPVGPALAAVAPMLAFLAAALTLAALAERAGLARRAAALLARAAHPSALALYAAVCALCAVLTAVVSLDGAVVLTVPVALVLARERRAPLGPLLAGIVVVANAASIAVPLGNPTNLVVIERLGLSPGAFAAHLLVPGLAAALACAAAVALQARRALAARARV
ncbi:MAG TPA: SLC13 family permease, partial [Conexibacter sp.]|nr:SLC13 family permease [Conexibacter sp.]